jgi:heterodisulfide reductase subunit A
MRSAEEAMGEMVDAITDNPLVDIRLNTSVIGSEGDAPNLKVTLQNGSNEEVVDVGSVIVSTGFQHFDPGKETQMYGYYEHDDVITLVDAEKMLKEDNFLVPSTGKKPEQICFIQCVGSRDRQIGNQWCSKVCCGIACKQAIEIRDILPETRVFVFYIDMRMYGFWEDEIYWKAQEEKNVNFIRGIVTEITKRGAKLLVKGEDTTMGRPMEIPMDMVVLSVGMEPSKGTTEMAGTFKLPLESHGFIETTGGALNTVQTKVPGVFVAGAAAGPADLEDSISMGGSAVMKACAFLRKSELQSA